MPSIAVEARLAFTEFLLSADDLSDCVGHGLDWLRQHVGVSQALCAVASGDGDYLWGVSGIGISPARTGEFVVDLRNRQDPLARVAHEGRPQTFGLGGARPETPLDERMPFHAMPIRRDPRQAPLGLLLVEAVHARPSRALLWFARVLGDKIQRLRTAPASHAGLDRERRLLFSIINAVSDPIVLTDGQGKLILGNARAEQLLAAASESEGHRRALELNNLFFSSALASTTLGQPHTGAREVVLVEPEDGSDLLFELITTPILLEGGESGFVSVLRNVTDLGRATMELEEHYRRVRSAEARVRAERNRMELVIDSVIDPIVVSDPNGGILLTNKPAEGLFTARSGEPQASRRAAANVAQFSSFTSGVLMSADPDRIRSRLTLTDPQAGRTVPVEAIAAVVPGDADFPAVVTVLHDLTEALERERLVAELKLATDQLEARVRDATAELALQNERLREQAVALEHASAAKSRFLASISHEFRTPLNAILGYTWLLLQEGKHALPPEVRRMMVKVDSNSRYLAALISDVLDISRIEADQMPVQVQTFELPALVHEVLEELEALVASSPVPVTVSCDRRLEPLASDRQKLKQILVNLLTNALKFTERGEIRIEAAHAGPGRCRVSVQDTGTGIAAEDQERIFEAFEQGSGRRRSAGTGLGLAIAQRLAALLGGQIRLASELGAGSTFTLEIPCRLTPTDAGVAMPAGPTAVAATAARGTR